MSTIFGLLVNRHAWPHQRDPRTGALTATSWCGRIEVAAEPAVWHLWRVSVRRHPTDRSPLWQATFSKETPAEIVSAFVGALADDRRTAPEEIVAEHTASPTTAWRPLLKAGWTSSDLTAVVLGDGSGAPVAVHAPAAGGTAVDGIRVTSPDEFCSLSHHPRPDEAFDQGVGPWMVEAAFGPDWDDQWTAILSAETPVRYLTRLTRAVVDPAPVLRAPDQVSAATRAVATVRTAPAPARQADPPAFDPAAASWRALGGRCR
ncbi:DUF317 domain-containing protein [Kitasatospora sp. NPDC049285]|uniref:DUF317 domain-containing protein n=1 Tax=Kitasatospora sp. NPDC049285 TaxID=3157096 RepID=UPI00341AD426